MRQESFWLLSFPAGPGMKAAAGKVTPLGLVDGNRGQILNQAAAR
jgi:hypothetical protein